MTMPGAFGVGAGICATALPAPNRHANATAATATLPRLAALAMHVVVALALGGTRNSVMDGRICKPKVLGDLRPHGLA
jgi:hypothetical protein